MRAQKQDETKDLQERTKLGELAGLLTVAVNLALVLAKSALLFCAPSGALGADVQGGLSDVLSGLFSFLGFRLARASPRGRFERGFSRAESLGAFSVSLWMMFCAIGNVKESVSSFTADACVGFGVGGLVLLFAFAAAKLFLGIFLSATAKRIGSATLALSAKDSFLDSATGLLVPLASLGAAWLDAAAGLLLSLLLFWTGIVGAWERLPHLIGTE